MLEDYLRQYGLLAIFAVIALVVPASMLIMSHMASRLGIRPSNPTPVKLETYECGVETIGGTWNRFHFRYYLFAILFLIFDVEAVFLFPWAVTFVGVGQAAFYEMVLFIVVLGAGLGYAWKKGVLQWK